VPGSHVAVAYLGLGGTLLRMGSLIQNGVCVWLVYLGVAQALGWTLGR
jgi:hypothetical protein